MAKTHLSLSDDATKPGRPKGFTINVREVRLAAGAGYLVALTGEIMTMSYRAMPETAFDDADEALAWAKLGIEAAARAQK
jgi:formyltetrahydrofolate synthetase